MARLASAGAVDRSGRGAPAFSRVYVAAHYPGDVVAGLLLGAAVALLGWLLLRVPLTRVTGWLRGRPAVRAVFAPASQVAAEPAVTRLA